MASPIDPAAPLTHRKPVIVGREREQALLHLALDSMLGGHGGLLLVSGEAGIGKTTLVEWLAEHARGAGALVLWGHAYDLSVTPPYGPWLEIFDTYPQREGGPALPAFVGDLQATAALGSQGRLFTATRDFLSEVAARQPLVLILEDLHWADQDSLDFLRFVARRLSAQRLLVAATYRVEELHRHHRLHAVLPLLIRESAPERLELRPLDAAAHRALILKRYTVSPTDQARLESFLATHGEGNPLFALELLRTLEDDGALTLRSDGWALGDLHAVRVPPLLQQMIEGRLRRLGDQARRLLQIAAIIGQEVPFDLWQQVSGANEQALDGAVDKGVAAHLLAETSVTVVRFRHALFREALYAEVSRSRRRVWHQRVAEILEGLAMADPDAIAYHFQQAGDVRAGRWFIRAGDQAERAYAWVTAAERFAVARRLLVGVSIDPGEYGWLLLRIAAIGRYGDLSRAMEALEAAAIAADTAQDPVLRAYILLHRGQLRCLEEKVDAGLADLETGVAAVGALAPSERARIENLPRSVIWAVDGDGFGSLVFHLARSGRYLRAVRLAESLAVAGHDQDESPQPDFGHGDAFEGLAIAYAALGKPREARLAFARSRTTFERLGHHFHVADTLEYELNMVHLPYGADDLLWRSRLLEAGREALDRASGTALYDTFRVFDLSVQILQGQWESARAFLQADPARLLHLVALSMIALAQGDWNLATSALNDAFPEGALTEPGNKRFFYAVPMQRVAVALALQTGDLAGAHTWLDANARWLDWANAVLGRAEHELLWAQLHLAGGNPALARQHAEQALAHASAPRQPLALIAVLRLLGELDTADRDYAEGERQLQVSLALATACAAPFERALTLLALAALRAAQAKPDEAHALLAEVRAICEPLAAEPTLAYVAAVEQQLTRMPQARPFGLTERESEVLRLVAEGLTDAQIAEQLYLSPRTVGAHLRNLYNKLGVNTRTAATRLAVEHELL